jgi:endonuclease-3 related protein
LTAHELFEALLEIYGPQGWWPADSFDELCLGAILVQNTSWNNASMALSNLAEKGLLSLPSVASAPLWGLEKAVYPSGTYRRKAAIIAAFARDFTADFKTAESFRGGKPLSTRKWLLKRKGIGQETADSILCYGANAPFLVIDRYARRLVKRTGLVDERISSYEAIQECLQNDLPEDAQVLGEFHALVVRHGKSCCGKSPSCETCPLGARCSFANSGTLPFRNGS